MAYCLHAFFSFEGVLLNVETGFTGITAQQKCTRSSKFSFCSPFGCFVHALYLWKRLSLSRGPKLPQALRVMKSQKFAEDSEDFIYFWGYWG
jgi:hypothetical protein